LFTAVLSLIGRLSVQNTRNFQTRPKRAAHDHLYRSPCLRPRELGRNTNINVQAIKTEEFSHSSKKVRYGRKSIGHGYPVSNAGGTPPGHRGGGGHLHRHVAGDTGQKQSGGVRHREASLGWRMARCEAARRNQCRAPETRRRPVRARHGHAHRHRLCEPCTPDKFYKRTKI